MASALETVARREWGTLPWRLFTVCRDCGEPKNCAGKRRSAMRCLDCYDQRKGGVA